MTTEGSDVESTHIHIIVCRFFFGVIRPLGKLIVSLVSFFASHGE